VEFALILPLLLLLSLGILEFGVLMLHQLTLTQVAREGSRCAARGGTVSEIEKGMVNMAGALPNHDELGVTLTYSTDQGETYAYSLGDQGGENDAPPGSLIKVTLNWPHHLLTGGFFSWLTGAAGERLPLRADLVMRRE
jgi:hypothetical protein